MKAVIAVLLLSIPAMANSPGRLVLRESFDSMPAGWELGPEWQIGPAQGSAAEGVGNGDPDRDVTPGDANGIAGVRIGGNASTSAHPEYYWLTSPPVDAGHGRGTLRFERWLNSDRSPYMNNRIEVWNGRSWVTVWESRREVIIDRAWHAMEIDVSGHLNSAFRVRFGFARHPGAMTSSSWNLDDVSLEVFDTPNLVGSIFPSGSLAGLATLLLCAATIPIWYSSRG